MKAAAAKYMRADSSDEAVAALAAYGDAAKVLAGGQSLVALMNLRLAQPDILLDIGRAGLSEITSGTSLEIGAMATQNQALRNGDVARHAPLMQEALRHVSHHTLRNRGTIGGSVAHADPSAELPAVLVALGGEVVARSARAVRVIPADDFFVGHFATSLADDELLTSVRIPSNGDRPWAFYEIARRQGDFALAGVAASFACDVEGTVESARLVLFAVDSRPLRLPDVEAALVGSPLGDQVASEEAARLASAAVEPAADVHGSTSFRKRLTGVAVRRALRASARIGHRR